MKQKNYCQVPESRKRSKCLRPCTPSTCRRETSGKLAKRSTLRGRTISSLVPWGYPRLPSVFDRQFRQLLDCTRRGNVHMVNSQCTRLPSDWISLAVQSLVHPIEQHLICGMLLNTFLAETIYSMSRSSAKNWIKKFNVIFLSIRIIVFFFFFTKNTYSSFRKHRWLWCGVLPNLNRNSWSIAAKYAKLIVRVRIKEVIV